MNDYYACLYMLDKEGRYSQFAEYAKGYGYCPDLMTEQLVEVGDKK